MGISAAIVGALVAAGTGAAQGVQSAHAKKTRDNQMAGQQYERDQALRDAKKKEMQERQGEEATLLRNATRAKEKSAAARLQGRSGTIMTSPIGIPGGSSGGGGGKTLLGQ